MFATFAYIILAVLAIGFLIFIHELGHYFMALRVGMKVNALGIGFGKPIFSWVRNGVTWNLCWLPFGGYVKIAGMDKEQDIDPEKNPEGFFGKRPIDRIKVALMGPLVNIVFAFLAFAALWALGGREKNFSEYTNRIGWIDTHSELYSYGVRPGDIITHYNANPYQGAKDHLYAPMTAGTTMDISGYKVNYPTGEKTPFTYSITPYPHPTAVNNDVLTSGILSPTSYVFYNPPAGESIPEGSSMRESGIQPGDRILWIDGTLVHSPQQMNHIINDDKVLVTIQRGSEQMLRRVPRIAVQELRLDTHIKDELADWQFEAQLNNTKLTHLLTIPYDLTSDAVVVTRLKFIDKDKTSEIFPSYIAGENEEPLEPGDHIIAIDGTPIKYAYQLFYQLQKHRINIIVERDPALLLQEESWPQADASYDQEINWKDLQAIASTVGTENPLKSAGLLHLLNPVTPKKRAEITLSPERQALYVAEVLEQKKVIEAMSDSEKKAQALRALEQQEKQLVLGLPYIQDRKVHYNPSPLEMFSGVFKEIWQTLAALFSGYLSPKWLAGPVGMVQMVQHTWSVSAREVLFWLGAISLNLGILNLLPVPVLDGGYIVMSLFEMVTGTRLKPKTIEKMIVPFAVLLIGLLIFLTYHDLVRLFGNFLS